MSWTWVVVLLAIVAAVALAARPLLARLRRDGPDRARLAIREVFRDLVPMPAPSVRTVTKRLVSACRRQRVELPFGGRSLLPDAFEIGLSAPEYDAVADYLPLVTESVAETLTRQARERDWTLSGPPTVTVERDEEVPQGMPRVRARATRPPPPVTLDRPAGGSDRAQRPARPDLPNTAAPPRPRPEPALSASVAGEPTQRFTPARGGVPTANGVAQHTDDGHEPTRMEGGATDPADATEATGVESPPPPTGHRLESAGAHPVPDILVTTSTTVGRGEGCDVVVGYPAASRRHVRLDAVLAGCLVTDLGSTHGTYVDGEPVQAPTLLRTGQSVRLGRAGPTWVYRPS